MALDPGFRRDDGQLWRGASVLLLLLLWLAASLLSPAPAQTFPKFSGLVTDAADVLPADRRAALETKLQQFQQQTGRQLVVATIPDLQGYPLEDYGYRFGRAWGVGLKGADNGVILFVAPNEPAGHRGPRIEVGRRLEPVLTDAMSSVIINTRMMPLLRSGDVPGALDAGADAIVELLRLPDDQARAQATKAAAEFDRSHRRGGAGGVPLALMFWLFVLGFVALAFLRGHGGGRSRRYSSGGGSNWPIWLWAASELLDHRDRGGFGGGGGGSGGIFGGGGGSSGGGDGGWFGGGFTGGGGGDFGGGGASGDW